MEAACAFHACKRLRLALRGWQRHAFRAVFLQQVLCLHLQDRASRRMHDRLQLWALWARARREKAVTLLRAIAHSEQHVCTAVIARWHALAHERQRKEAQAQQAEARLIARRQCLQLRAWHTWAGMRCKRRTACQHVVKRHRECALRACMSTWLDTVRRARLMELAAHHHRRHTLRTALHRLRKHAHRCALAAQGHARRQEKLLRAALLAWTRMHGAQQAARRHAVLHCMSRAAQLRLLGVRACLTAWSLYAEQQRNCRALQVQVCFIRCCGLNTIITVRGTTGLFSA